MGDKQGKSVDWVSVFSWIFKTAKTLWDALEPVWNAIGQLWDGVKGIYDGVGKIWEYVTSSLSDVYRTFIKPLVDGVKWVTDKINDTIRWVDDLYDQTIGKIEAVYETLFGPLERLWKRFEDFRDKSVRLIGFVSKDLAAKIVETTDRIEQATLGKIRDLRQNLEQRISDSYHSVRDYANGLYWSLKDIVDPWIAKAQKIEDLIKPTIEGENLLAGKTVKVTTRKYGNELWDELSLKKSSFVTEEEKKEPVAKAHQALLDKYIEEVNLGPKGTWADVHEGIDKAIKELNEFEDIPDLALDIKLLREEEKGEFLLVTIDAAATLKDGTVLGPYKGKYDPVWLANFRRRAKKFIWGSPQELLKDLDLDELED